MATSSISSDVTAANSKIAEFLRRQEEEEMILQIGKRKPKQAKQAKQDRLPGGSGRWKLDPDWKVPTPMVDRPRTVAGSTSFHFSYISVAKQAVPTHDGKPVEGRMGNPRNAALEHSKYIERDGAAELSQGAGADHAAYIERDGAAEMLDPSALMSEDVERTIAAVINETPTAEEAELLGFVDLVPEGIPSVFSNISDDPFERQEFWRAVERSEREPKTHQIIMEPDISPAWWREVETTTKLDPEFKEHALKIAEAYRQHQAKPLADGEVRKPFIANAMHCSAEKAGRFISQCQRMAHYNDASPPFEFKSGRGGRIQFRMVAELPHELTAEDRALIVQNFCDHIATLQERRNLDGSPYRTGMMYTAVIHAPDAHNDSRNYHLHVVAYDRPCRFMPEHGQWDFEVQETYQDPGSRKDRIRYPYRQAKIEELSRVPRGQEDRAATVGINFVPTLRAKFAEINNLVLKARGIPRQLDPRKYTEMGIDRTPTEHLGTKAAALEAIGVPTPVGQLNAIAIWSDAERAIRRQAAQASKAYKAAQSELQALSSDLAQHDPNHHTSRPLRRLMVERERLIVDVAEDRQAIMTFDHMEAKAKSRAVRTRQTCLKFLADIEAGRADRNTRLMRVQIEERWQAAQNHINKIDAALEPHRANLARAARYVEDRERRIAAIDEELKPLRAVIEGSLDRFRKTAKVKAGGSPKASISTGPNVAVDKPPVAGADAVAPTPVQPAPATPAASPSAAAPAPATPVQPVAKDPTPEPEEIPQSVEPVSIAGLPIVEPTIAPPPEAEQAPIDLQAGTPDGLEPLRPVEVTAPTSAEPEIIVADLDNPSAEPPAQATEGLPQASPEQAGASVADPSSEPAQSAPAGPDATATPAPNEPESISSKDAPQPKVDGRKKVTDPVLFDLPAQEPSVKPGTTKAALADFDNLIKKVMDERIPIAAEKQANGTTKFSVPSLTPEQQDLLHNPRFAHRTNQRLGAIMEKQKQEIQRVLRWIATSGQNPENLRLENRTASLGSSVKDSVRNLFRHWRGHGDVTAALRAEYERRIEAAKAEKAEVEKPKLPPGVDEKEMEERRMEGARIYPDPSQAISPEVKEFTRLLRALAPEPELRAAADKIHASAFARDEINKHTVYLATAYTKHVESFDQHLAQQRALVAKANGR